MKKKIIVKKAEVNGNPAAVNEPAPRKFVRASVPPRTARPAGALARPSARRPPPSPRASQSHGSSHNVPLLVTIGAVVVIVLIFGIAVGSTHRTAPPSSRQQATVPAARPQEPTRFDELGGKTMAEWMAENNKDNQALQERQARLRKARAGGTP